MEEKIDTWDHLNKVMERCHIPFSFYLFGNIFYNELAMQICYKLHYYKNNL
jgi:hypothetical protein